MNRLLRSALLSLVVGGLIFAGSRSARGGEIDAGEFDWLHVIPGEHSWVVVDFSTFGGGEIPVSLIGSPFPSPLVPGTNTDTIVERQTGLLAGETGPIEIEIVALQLRSVEPVPVADSFFDVFVQLDFGGPTSDGTVDITQHNDPDGGTFDSFFDIFVTITLNEHAGFGSGHEVQQRQFTLQSNNGQWFHSDLTDFYIQPFIVSDGSDIELLLAPAQAIIPEPTSLALLLTGGLGLLIYRRKTRVV
ncbi:MAG: PEP-CTERM sorting domain-containing protein [Planctomycetota bacterium]|nr:PEP-CTERM sorting domain-containing protein [Planctomycetota bacterium]MDA1214182.1 PEP-CTERM sorting domain-containing protein [Planctomycetota bacterium]